MMSRLDLCTGVAGESVVIDEHLQVTICLGQIALDDLEYEQTGLYFTVSDVARLLQRTRRVKKVLLSM